MKTIGSTDIWTEGTYNLCQRFLRLSPHQRGITSPGDLENKIMVRLNDVLSKTNLNPSPPITNPRQWETKWKVEEELKRLNQFLARLDYSIVVEQAGRIETHQLPGVGTEKENNLILDADAASERISRLKKAGLLLKVTQRDGLVLMICEEIFHIHADALGPFEPAPLIDNIARHFFVRDMLGLPFLPWVADLILHEEENG